MMLLMMLVVVAFLALLHVSSSLQSSKPSVLIVQNKGGGHGSIGFELCKSIKRSKPDYDIHVIQDKCNYKTVPFSSYSELKSLGVNVIDTSLGDVEACAKLTAELSSKKFDFVIDNWSKGIDNAKFCLDIAKKTGVSQYVFISSAGMYKSNPLAPLVETDAVKTNDPRKVEIEVTSSGIPYTFLRPQYIYGSKCNKRYLDYFIGRSLRKLPVPLPTHGEQLVCLTHLEDVADFITAAIGHKNAVNEIFNCGTDLYVSYKGLAKLINAEVGNTEEDARFIYYDPDQFSHWDGKGVQEFPFRKETFITTPSKAKQLLGWAPKHSLLADLKEEVAEYRRAGGASEQWTGEETKYDAEILAAKKAPTE